jgi:hypothetical protein
VLKKKVGVLRDSHYLFQRHIGNLNIFLARKIKKTVLAGLRLKSSNGTVRCEPPRGATTVPERAIVALYYSGFFWK